MDRRTTPPGPPLPNVAQTALWIRRPIELMRYCRKQYGPTFRLDVFSKSFVFLSDPGSIRAVFTAKPHVMYAGEANRILRPVVGDSSVLLLDEGKHMRQRKLLLPSFHGERMRFYGRTMAEVTRRSIASWPVDRVFSLHPFMQDITLQVILRTVFGVEDERMMAALGAQLKKMLSRGEQWFSTILLMYLSEHPDVEKAHFWRWILKDRNEADRLIYEQIALRRKDARSAGRKDVLGMLMQARDDAGQCMSDVELRDELMTALAAGHETTATALAWAFERILSTPSVYRRLREEVAPLGEGDAVEPERMADSPLLDATVKEVLRLRPVIPVVGRVLQEPVTLGGYDLSAGDAVAPCIYLVHRDPDIYPDPDAFRPERFLETQPDPNAWLPFGGGFRRCIGAAFAVYEMKIVLGTIVASCNLELAQSSPARVVRRAVTFWPDKGTRVACSKRAACASGARRKSSSSRHMTVIGSSPESKAVAIRR